MPILNSHNMDTQRIGGSHYGFSGKRVNDLGACEYTLASTTSAPASTPWSGSPPT
jgi:hypothetical protein